MNWSQTRDQYSIWVVLPTPASVLEDLKEKNVDVHVSLLCMFYGRATEGVHIGYYQ
jgi:hypothetical protein